jgi:hypothetical protein
MLKLARLVRQEVMDAGFHKVPAFPVIWFYVANEPIKKASGGCYGFADRDLIAFFTMGSLFRSSAMQD